MKNDASPLRSATLALGIGLLFLSPGAIAKKNCAQGGNERDGECLVFLGKARVETASDATVAQRSFWLSSNIFDNSNTFYLNASSWTSTAFDLAPEG